MSYRIWSKKIINVLKKYKSGENVLFAITGDIDNLGIYVSEHGRANAENLVDVYNHIIGAIIKKYAKQKKFVDFAFIPSGEEIFAIGIAKDNSDVYGMERLLKDEINDVIQSNCKIAKSYVTISFGVKVLNNFYFSDLLEAIQYKRTENANDLYLQLMYKIRDILAQELDKQKFSSLKPCEYILYRNCVYACMREYKEKTKSKLIRLASALEKNDVKYVDLMNTKINKEYGIDYNIYQNLINLIR